MKMSTERLREKIATAENQLYARYRSEIEQGQGEYDSKLRQWKIQTAPELRQQLINALGVLDDTGILTTADVRDRVFNSTGSGGLLWPSQTTRPADSKTREDWEPPTWFVELRSFMDSVQDDVVTSYALEKAGVLKHVTRLR